MRVMLYKAMREALNLHLELPLGKEKGVRAFLLSYVVETKS